MKKIVVFMLVLSLVAGFTACAGEKESNAKESDTMNTQKTEASGVVTLELYPKIAPITVENFVSLAKSGFYDGLTFHRVYAGFMIQGGDPNGNGSGGSGKNIKGEFAANGFDNSLSHTRGVISMARSKPYDSASSQFFIMHQDSTFLDGSYAAFGKVTEGMDVIDAVAGVECTYNPVDRKETTPVDPPVIEYVKVLEESDDRVVVEMKITYYE